MKALPFSPWCLPTTSGSSPSRRDPYFGPLLLRYRIFTWCVRQLNRLFLRSPLCSPGIIDPSTGLGMGWLRVHHQLDSPARLCASAHGPLFQPDLHGLHHLFHPGPGPIHADPLCRYVPLFWCFFLKRLQFPRLSRYWLFLLRLGFQPVRTSEHMASLGVFALLNAVAILRYLQSKLSSTEIKYVFTFGVLGASAIVFLAVVLLTYAGVIAPWSGRYWMKLLFESFLMRQS